MRLQHEADTNIAGCISNTHNVGVVDLRTGDSLPAQIEVSADSDSPIEPLPARISIRGRNRHLLGNSLWGAATVDSRFGSGLRTTQCIWFSRIALGRGCLRVHLEQASPQTRPARQEL